MTEKQFNLAVQVIILTEQNKPKRKRIKRNLGHPYFGSVGWHRSQKRHGTKHHRNMKVYKARKLVQHEDELIFGDNEILEYPLAETKSSYVEEPKRIVRVGWQDKPFDLML